MSSASNQENDQAKALLTVRIDRESLDWAKEYARRTDTTVSHLVRDFLRHLRSEVETPEEEVQH